MDSAKQEPEEISEIISSNLLELDGYVKEEPEDLNILEFQLLEELELNDASVYNLPFSCKYCGAGFKQKSSLQMHQNYKKVGNKYVCRVGGCFSSFSCKQQKYDHVELFHPPDQSQTWKCSECSFISSTSRGLKSHSKIHKTTTLLSSHRQTHNKHSCSKCGLQFGIRKDFREHQSQMGNFKCLLCEKEFVCESARSQHLERDHEKDINELATLQHKEQSELDVEIQFECDHCGLSFGNRPKLLYHMNDHLKFDFSCDDCGARFYRLENLTFHRKTYSGNFKCARKNCNKVFKCKQALKMHARDEHDQNCPECTKIFKTKKHLQAHRNKQHNTKFQCDLCDLSFLKERALTFHKWSFHRNQMYRNLNKNQKFSCYKCGKQFKILNNFIKHKILKHPNQQTKHSNRSIVPKQRQKKSSTVKDSKNDPVKPSVNQFACSKCGMKFADRKGLKIHEKRGSKLFCEICDEKVQCKLGLAKHIKQNHEKNLKCRKCPFVGKYLEALKTHCKKFHKAQSVVLQTSLEISDTHNKYACSKCGLEFGTRKDFRGHQSQIGIFKCLLCDEKFECEYARNQHLEKDHEKKLNQLSTLQKKESLELETFDFEIQFECDHCGLTFDKKQKIRYHMLDHLKFAHSCDDCGARFSRLENLTFHRKNYSGHFICKKMNSTKIDCLKKCNKVFECKLALTAHIRKDHGKIWKCTKCSEAFKTTKKLLVHCNKQHNKMFQKKSSTVTEILSFENENDHVKRNRFACCKCGQKFVDREGLKRHEKLRSKLTCEICDQEFQCKFGLGQHIRRDHENEFECRKCPFVGTNLQSLRSHCNSRHKAQSVTLEPSLEMPETLDKHACSKCGLEFGTRKGFREHQLKMGIFKCLFCNEEFECEYARSQHLEDHDEDIDHRAQLAALQHKESSKLEAFDVEMKFQCDHCGLSFDKKRNLLQHKNIVHGKFVSSCEECGGRSRDINLTWHRKMYSGTFKCSRKNCDKVFKCKRALKIHARDEHEQNWKCPECPKTLMTRKKFKSHLTKYHGKHRGIAEPLRISKNTKYDFKHHSMVAPNQQEMTSEISQRLDESVKNEQEDSSETESETETLGMNIHVKEEPEVSYVLKLPLGKENF